MDDIFGSILGYVGQQETNSANAEIAQKQMDFQERLSNSAYQRQVADMSAAGLNPMLAYMKGGGASTPSGATSTYTSPIQGALQGANTSAQTAKTKAEIPKVQAETSNVEAHTKLTNAQVEQVDASVSKIKQEIENMPKGITMGRSVSEWNTEAIRYAVEKVKDESKLILSKDTTEQVHQNQMRALISKLNTETALGKLDLKAAEELLNAGRLGKELEPFARMFFNIMRSMR